MSKCSIIIVNYNTGDMLNQVVTKIIDCYSVESVIVVDNNSKDESMKLLQPHEKLQIIIRKENHGFAKSCNYGAKYTQSESLLFLNPDCLIECKDLDLLLIDLNNNEKTGIVGCMVQNPDGTEQRASRRRLPTLIRSIKTFSGIEKMAKFFHGFAGVNMNHLHAPNKNQSVEAISGAFILIKYNVFKKLNGFDEKFPLHFEDLDLFKRCLNIGNRIIFNPNVNAIHFQGLSSQSNPQVAVFKKMGLQRYFHKHCTFFSYMIIKIFNKLT
ncbi:MAG: glycosyltransferase family 2 protein [Marinicellaceae bacterium]